MANIEAALTMAKMRGAANRAEELELIAITAAETWRSEDEIEAIAERLGDEVTEHG